MAMPFEDCSNTSRATKINYREFIFLTLLMFSKRIQRIGFKQN